MERGRTGTSLILRLCQCGRGCGPGATQHARKEQSCPTCSSRLQAPALAAVPSRSTGHHGVWDPAVEGRQERKGGWHSRGDADGTRASWPQTRSVTHPLPSTHLWGQLSLEGAGCQAEGAQHPGVPTEVQHLWCSVLIHPPWSESLGWILALTQRCAPGMLLLFQWFSCKTGAVTAGKGGRGTG